MSNSTEAPEAPANAGTALLERPAELTADLLEEAWERKLHCQVRGHKDNENSVAHEPKADATFRGYPPCGRVMNICAKFADYLITNNWRSIPCQCGKRHWASTFRFVQI